MFLYENNKKQEDLKMSKQLIELEKQTLLLMDDLIQKQNTASDIFKGIIFVKVNGKTIYQNPLYEEGKEELPSLSHKEMLVKV